jgi:hypothetical protein
MALINVVKGRHGENKARQSPLNTEGLFFMPAGHEHLGV